MALKKPDAEEVDVDQSISGQKASNCFRKILKQKEGEKGLNNLFH